jgi:hypothetical protein
LSHHTWPSCFILSGADINMSEENYLTDFFNVQGKMFLKVFDFSSILFSFVERGNKNEW